MRRNKVRPRLHTIKMTDDVILIESEYTKNDSLELLIRSLAINMKKKKPERFDNLVQLLNCVNENMKEESAKSTEDSR